LAASTLHIVTGLAPWSRPESKHAPPVATILYKILESTTGPPRDAKTLSPFLNHWLTCCFQRNPSDRPTAHECLSHPWFSPDTHEDGGSAYTSAREPASLDSSWANGVSVDTATSWSKPEPVDSVDVIVVGAGMAGLACAGALKEAGASVVVLESRARVGGRIHTWQPESGPCIDLGAAWLYGTKKNPIAKLASSAGAKLVTTDWDSCDVYDEQGRKVPTTALDEGYDEFNKTRKQIEKLRRGMEEDTGLWATICSLVSPDTDTSVNSALRVAWKDNVEWEYALPLEQLSTLYFDLDEDLKGQHKMLEEGLGAVVSFCSRDLDVRLSHRVTAIAENTDGEGVCVSALCRGRVVQTEARFVVVTLPLGVLKRAPPTFSPPLPSRKLAAVERIGLALVNKVALVFPEVFWPRRVHQFRRTGGLDEEVLFDSFINYAAVTSAPVLVAYVTAAAAKRVEELDDDETLAACLKSLQQCFPSVTPIPRPTSFQITRWGRDPHSYCSYTAMALGSSPADRRALAQPHGSGERIRFAGEATESKFPGTVHGAFFSGKREADAIKQELKLK